MRKIKSLADAADEESVRGLARLLERETDLPLRVEALLALGETGSEESLAPLQKALADPEPEIRAAAAEALGGLDAAPAREALMGATADPNPATRAAAIRSLALREDAEIIPTLLERLKDVDAEVSFAAAGALAAVGGGAAVLPVFDWVQEMFGGSAKLSAMEKLERARRAVAPLLGRLSEESLHSVAGGLMLQVTVKAWEPVDGGANTFGWATSTCKNPLWKPIQDEIERREKTAGAAPVAANGRAAAAHDAGLAAESAPALGAIVKAFLATMRDFGCNDLALIGGAVRDAALGAAPRSLDVALRAAIPEPLPRELAEAAAWNRHYASAAAQAVAPLAKALGATIDDIIQGKAHYSAAGASLLVRYVGPWLAEETRSTIGALRIEQRVERTISRVGLVADPATGRAIGLGAEPSINRMWIDHGGRWRGGWTKRLSNAGPPKLEIDAGARPAGVSEICRILAAKHETRLELAEPALEELEAAAARAKADRRAAIEGFCAADFDRLLAFVSPEGAIEELDLLGVAALLPEALDEPRLRRIGAILSRREGGASRAAMEIARDLELSRAEAASLRDALASLRERLRANTETGAALRAKAAELERKCEAAAAEARSAEEGARIAAARLARAAKDFSEFASGESFNPAIMREHRDAQAGKRERDERLAQARAEAERAREELARARAAMAEREADTEAIAQELDAIPGALAEAQGRVSKAEEGLARAKADNAPSAAWRRERLRRPGA